MGVFADGTRDVCRVYFLRDYGEKGLKTAQRKGNMNIAKLDSRVESHPVTQQEKGAMAAMRHRSRG
jgi:hypothetical protein